MKRVDVNNLLPIGSIVSLKNVDIKIMIAGVYPQVKETGEEFDYLGVTYPFGYVSDRASIFSRNAVDEVIFRGYEDKKRKDWIKVISQSEEYLKIIHSDEEENIE